MNQDFESKDEILPDGVGKAKKKYASPNLFIHGDVKKITQAGMIMMNEAMHTGSMPP